MLRKSLERTKLGKTADFRWRGGEVMRIEAFSDAVFAFSVTLLVVSLEVPKTFNELQVAMKGFIAFALSFTLLIWIWYNHYVFFRRYGLQDAYTVVFNALLLFVVLFYIYPLKFLATLVVGSFMGSELAVHGLNGESLPVIEPGQSASLMMVYGTGFLLVFLCFALMYVHAYRKRVELELNGFELFDTITEVQEHMLYAFVGTIAVIVAYFIGDTHAFVSSLPYWLIGPFMAWHGSSRGKKRRGLAHTKAEKSVEK